MERLEQTGKRHMVNGVEVKSRKKTGNKWFELSDSIAYWQDLCEPKIVWKAVGRRLAFAIAGEEFLLTAPACFISGKQYNQSILAYLCSDYGSYFIYKYSDTTGAGDIMVNVQSLVKVMIPLDVMEDVELQKAIKSEDYQLIEECVFNSFNLNDEERRYIKHFVSNF